jgi:hypothetical protein
MWVVDGVGTLRELGYQLGEITELINSREQSPPFEQLNYSTD